jgi:hypothetical protein
VGSLALLPALRHYLWATNHATTWDVWGAAQPIQPTTSSRPLLLSLHHHHHHFHTTTPVTFTRPTASPAVLLPRCGKAQTRLFNAQFPPDTLQYVQVISLCRTADDKLCCASASALYIARHPASGRRRRRQLRLLWPGAHSTAQCCLEGAASPATTGCISPGLQRLPWRCIVVGVLACQQGCLPEAATQCSAEC